ncbi:MAG: discoidin domain-containing protein [Massilia sp.]
MKRHQSGNASRRVFSILIAAGLATAAGSASAANAIQNIATNYQPAISETIDASGFKHPGVGLTREILENLRAEVRAQKEPWNSYFNDMVLSSSASRTAGSSNQGSDPAKPSIYGLASQGDNSRFIADGMKAYTQAVLYYISGDDTYRANAMRIIRLWEQMDPAQYAYFVDAHIHTGMPLNRMVAAAEILRYTSTQTPSLLWTDQDTALFTANLITPVIETFAHKNSYFMNQHNYPLIGATAGYIFTGNRDRYNEAIEWATVNKTAVDQGQNGAIKQLFRLVAKNDLTGEAVDPPAVQHVEMGRDQAHGAGDLTNNEILARMWLAQGTRIDPVDGTASTAPNAVGPYDYLNDRVLAATELFARFMMGYETPWIPVAAHTDPDGNPTIVYKQISGGYRGRLTQNTWESFYYYKYVKGIDIEARAPYYTKMFAARSRYYWDGPDGGGDFWFFIPAAAEAEGSKYLVKTIVEPYRELEDRFSSFDGNTVAMRDETAGFVRITATAQGSKLALVGSGNATKNLAFRIRTNGTALMEAFGDTITLPNTHGQWVYVDYALNAYQGLGDLLYLNVTGAGTTVDIDHINVQAGTLLTPPVFKLGNAALNVYTYASSTATLNFSFAATNANAGATLSYQIDNLPAGALFNTANGDFSWKPTQPGTYSFVVSSSDGTTMTTKTVQVVVSADRQSAVAAASAAYNANLIYVSSTLAIYNQAYSDAMSAVASASDDDFLARLAALNSAVVGLQQTTPLLSDGSMNYTNLFVATTFGTDLPNALDGSPDSFVGYFLAVNLTHTFDFGPSFKFSADAFQLQVRASFPERIGGVAMFGSNDNETWTRLTPGLTAVNEDLQTLPVQDDLKNQQFRFLKMQMIDTSGATSGPFLELSEFRIFGHRYETVNKLSAVSIGSPQGLRTRIVAGNTVNLSFKSTEAISNVDVKIQGQAATVTTTDNLNWTASWVANASVASGTVKFTLNYKTAAGIDASPTLFTTDGTSLYISDESNLIGNVLEIAGLKDSNGTAPADLLAVTQKLFDSNLTTASEYYFNGGGSGAYITFDFKGGGQATLSRVEVLARQDGYYTRLNGAVVQGSNDNATWETISNAAKSTLEWQTLTVNSAQPYRYIRMVDGGGWYGNMAELRLFGTSVSANKIATVSLSSAQSSRNRIVPGSTVKLSFTAKQAVNTVNVTIQGQSATVSTTDNINFTATATLPLGAATGAVKFAVNYKLQNGVDGYQNTETTDGSSLNIVDESDLIRNVTGITTLIDSTVNRTAGDTLTQVGYLFDGVLASNSDFRIGANNAGNGSYITFDLKGGNQAGLTSVEMAARQDGNFARVAGAVVMGSNDNATWETISSPAISTLDWQTLPISGGKLYRYIRIYNPNAWYGNLSELRLHGAIASSNKVGATSLTSAQSLRTRIVPGSTVKLSFTAKEAINSVNATIQGVPATVVTTDNVNYTATATLPQGVATGPVKFAINYKLQSGADGYPDTDTTDGTALTLVDETDLIRNVTGITTLIDSTVNRTAAATLGQVNNLFDGVLGTNSDFRIGSNNSGNGAFITFDFKAGNQTTLTAVELSPRQDGLYGRIAGTVIQGSNDNTAWTTLSAGAASTIEWQTLAVASRIPYRYIRIVNAGAWFGNMAEVRFHGSVQTSDVTAPVTTDNAPATTVNAATTVSLNATDASSGVSATYYTVDGGAQQTGKAVALSAAGKHTVVYWSVDWAGNVEPQHTVTVNIALDVNASVKLVQQGATLNRSTGKFVGSVTVTNTSGAPLTGPLQLKLKSLAAGLTLDNASGTDAGSPYVTLAGPLNAGATISVPLTFSNPGRVAVTYTPALYQGAF